jgi:hypothetical protein
MLKPLSLSFVAAALAAVTHVAVAAPVAALSYAMPNGDGVSSGGSFNYWDGIYNGSGSTNVDGAALSGGVGKLTDGIVSSSRWDAVSNLTGTGEYVGWVTRNTLNPTIVFSFASGTLIDSITIALDNSGFGGVLAPSEILIDGVSRAFTAPAGGTVGSVSFSNLGLTGSSHSVQFKQAPGSWTFVSEISFDGTPGATVPEPGSWALVGVALLACRFAGGLAGGLGRRGASSSNRGQEKST